MPMTDETDDSGGVILDGPFDPDAQATVTDFIDYTEYLPADLIRSLTLIRGLDDRYLDSAQAVHQLTQIYGQLPDLPSDDRPGAIALRKDISSQVDRAINARESAYAEACRLYDVVDRHFDRLGCIRQKLEALPKPASAEPSPPPEPTPKRARGGKKTNKDATTRITLRLDNNRNRRDKNRRRILGADGAFDPDSPLASTEQSDLESELIKSAPKPARPPKKEKARRLSSGIGQSTAQALAQLKPPPADAKLGSEDLPWLRLTEWEMTRLRKKMKKNAVWQPSEVMIHRELALANRGWEAYRAAKALAEETGGEFIDCDNIEETRRGEAAKDLEETKLSNRGMKLNEAKKLKREQLAREQALMEGEGGALPRPLPTPAQAPPPANRSSRKRKREELILGATELAAPEPSKSAAVATPVAPPAPVPAPSSRAGPSRRRSSRGNAAAAETSNDLVLPIKINMSPAVEAKPSPPPISPTNSGQSNLPLVHSVTTPTPPVTRPSSRRSAAAASIEGGTLVTIPTAIAASGRDRRIKSATPAHKTPIRESPNAPSVPAPARRRKRPAPGPISSGQDGGAAVSYGRRKAKPGKKRFNIRDSQDVRVDEDGVLEQIDANEPRYCLCGDVSFGTMICCENQDCDREWFHLNCVGLTEVPSRTAKWYCPQCRVKLHKGEDGIIKGSSRR
ncbi:Zinc finger PHD-type [Penicillium coprophilum]|uniref:Zinc finger PHD-type n=1 Tax=Penicillium coprophilum TaxID=36646 RepID=UPI0023A1EA15|nr:Zinc finger PHD-type [Penicillium coprophilum]KAJ5163625.1 Zinc finger PHD-type [Penicillium coprophilum]